MIKRFTLLFMLLGAAACGQIPVDRLLSEGKALKDVAVLAEESVLSEYGGLTVREVAFVNTGDAPLTVDAMEISAVTLEGTGIWSLQPSSSSERKDWVLPVEKGFYQRNYMGMNDSDYGGGIPLVCMWSSSENITTGLVEPCLKSVSIPVSRRGNSTRACIREDFDPPITLNPGDTLRGKKSFILKSEGDFFRPLRTYAAYMQDNEGFIPPVSPADAYEAVWCAWGYERTFTVDEVIGTLPKVKELGFKWVDLDDGYQICEGDWDANDRIGAEGMRAITEAIHEAGLKAKIWWAPLAADPESSIAREHPEMLLVQADGSHEDISWWDSWYLSPVNPYTWSYTEALVDQFLLDWGFDGFKLDGQHLNLSAPDYNPASGLAYPEEACERHPEFFRSLYSRAQADKPGSVVQICPCGCAVNFFILPYMNQAVASDPASSAQIRAKRKVYAALCPDLAYYADHVELSDGGMDFASQVGVGGVIGSKFTWPKPNPDATENGGSLLSPEKEEALRKWVGIYYDKMLSKGEYLGLYNYGTDVPEAHVIERDGVMYYSFYAPSWDGKPITLRGLGEGQYLVTEYTLDNPTSFTLDGADPVIRPTFEGNYLIEVKSI